MNAWIEVGHQVHLDALQERAERDLRLAEEQGRRQDAIDRESRVIDQDGEGIR